MATQNNSVNERYISLPTGGVTLTMTPNTTYILPANNIGGSGTANVFTLPSNANPGDYVEITGISGSTSIWSILNTASSVIYCGYSVSSAGSGGIAAKSKNDSSIKLRFIGLTTASSPAWNVVSGVGNYLLSTTGGGAVLVNANLINNQLGVTDGSLPQAGYVGELISANILLSAAVSLVNLTSKNITSVAISAGDWDLFGNGMISSGSFTSTIGTAAFGFSTTSNTLPDLSLQAQQNFTTALSDIAGWPVPGITINVSTPATVYLVAQAVFATGTVSACGNIFARRRR